jgi:hypothetical protein
MLKSVSAAMSLIAGIVLLVGAHSGEWITQGKQVKSTMGLQGATVCKMKCKDGACEEDGDNACESKSYETYAAELKEKLGEMEALAGFTKGTKVNCDWNGSPYPATVKKVDGTTLSIVYDDGTEEDLKANKCTLKEGSAKAAVSKGVQKLRSQVSQVELANTIGFYLYLATLLIGLFLIFGAVMIFVSASRKVPTMAVLPLHIGRQLAFLPMLACFGLGYLAFTQTADSNTVGPLDVLGMGTKLTLVGALLAQMFGKMAYDGFKKDSLLVEVARASATAPAAEAPAATAPAAEAPAAEAPAVEDAASEDASTE